MAIVWEVLNNVSCETQNKCKENENSSYNGLNISKSWKILLIYQNVFTPLISKNKRDV